MSKIGDDGILLDGIPGRLGPDRGRRPLIMGLAAGTAFVLITGAIYGLAMSGRSPDVAGPSPARTVPSSVTDSPSTEPEPEPAPEITVARTMDEALSLSKPEAVDQLRGMADDDRSRVEAGLDGSWVPQVSSKCEGITADVSSDWPNGTRTSGITAQEILGFHLNVQQQFGALTALPTWVGIDSDRGTHGVCAGKLVWLSLVPERFGSADAANAWCDAHVPPVDECLARLVAPGGNSKQKLR